MHMFNQSWNEPGFSWVHVEGICFVGASTKKSSDFIGHKGIGFKSVFAVAKAATILSTPTGYFFRLQEDSTQSKAVLQYARPAAQLFRAVSLNTTQRALPSTLFEVSVLLLCSQICCPGMGRPQACPKRDLGPDITRLASRRLQPTTARRGGGTEGHRRFPVPSDCVVLVAEARHAGGVQKPSSG